MRSLRTTILLSILLASATQVLAQPNPYGCHYFRQSFVAPTSLSDADRNQIDETIARSDTFDILHYDITLDVTDYVGKRLKAATTISFRSLMADQGKIRFDLVELTVDSVIGANGALAFTQDENYVRIDLGEVLAEGDERDLTVFYQGSPRRDPQ